MCVDKLKTLMVAYHGVCCDEESVHFVSNTSKKTDCSPRAIDTTLSTQSLLIVTHGGSEWKASLTVSTRTWLNGMNISLSLDASHEVRRALQASVLADVNKYDAHEMNPSTYNALTLSALELCTGLSKRSSFGSPNTAA